MKYWPILLILTGCIPPTGSSSGVDHPPLTVSHHVQLDTIYLQWSVRHSGPFDLQIEGMKNTYYFKIIALDVNANNFQYQHDLPSGHFTVRVSASRPPASHGYSGIFEVQ